MSLPAWPAPRLGRSACLATVLTFLVGAAFPAAAPGDEASPPNLVLIFCDDLGYGDLGCYGARGYQTPNLDQMAARGRPLHRLLRVDGGLLRLAGVAADRLLPRAGRHPGALGPRDRTGMSHVETTLAELLKQRGYATGMAGKWHLGSHPSQLPDPARLRRVPRRPLFGRHVAPAPGGAEIVSPAPADRRRTDRDPGCHPRGSEPLHGAVRREGRRVHPSPS